MGKVSVVQWMQHAYSDFFSFFSFSFILFLSLSLSLSLSSPPTHTRLHTQMVILSKILVPDSVPGGGGVGGGLCLAPNWVRMLEQKGRRKAPKQCVTILNTE